jgi:hypothetical protein
MEMICLRKLASCRPEPKEPIGIKFFCPDCKVYVVEDGIHELIASQIERMFFETDGMFDEA